MSTEQKKIIRVLNRFFKTDTAYLLHGVGWLGGAKLLGSIFSFGLVVAFANLLPAESYGTYSYVMAAVSIIALTSLPGIDSSLVRSVARGFDDSFKIAQRVRLRWSVIGATILILVSAYYWYQNNLFLSTFFLAGGLLFPAFTSFTLFAPYLNGKKQFRRLAITKVVVKFLFAVTLTVGLIFSDNVALLIALNLGVVALTGVFFTIKIVKQLSSIKSSAPEPGLISYGKHLTVMSILDTTSKYLDKILLWHFFGPVQVAIWAFAYTPIQIAQGMIKKTLGTLAMPKFAQNNFDLTKKQLPAKVVKLFLILIPFALLYVLISPVLFAQLFPQYIDSVIYSQVLIALLLLIPFNFFSAFLMAHARKRELYFIKIGFGLTSVGSLLIFIPLFGLWGAAIAHITAMTVRSTMSLFLFSRA